MERRKRRGSGTTRVQQAVASEREMKKERDLNRCKETIAAYKQANKNTKRAVVRARSAALRDLYESLKGEEGKRKARRIAKKRNQDLQDAQQVRHIKSAQGNVLTEEDDIKEGWRSYFDQLMNVENERIQSKVPAREEGRVWIVLGEEEVRKALSKMKKWKAVGPDDIPVEAWRALGGKGVTWLTEILCGVMASEKMPDEWRHSTLIQIYKNKGDIQECGNYRGIKLMSHSLKISERVIENRLRGTVTMSDQQFGFMPGRSTTDAIFALRQLMEKCREGQRHLHCVFIDVEKAYDRVPQMEVWNCLREKRKEWTKK